MRRESSFLVKNSMHVRRATGLSLEVCYLYHRKLPKFLVYVSGKLFFVQDIFNLSVIPRDMTLVTFFFSYVHHLLAKFGLVENLQSKPKAFTVQEQVN